MAKKYPYRPINGFHLMELLITIAIISILTASSVPVYQHYIVHGKRLEAENILYRLAIAMEQYHVERNSYQGATLAELDFPVAIVKNNYQLIIQSATDEDYVLIAKPLGNQSIHDTSCATLLLNANGEKGISGTSHVAECW
jgi:type IV pilus assembly protein PilE